MERGVSWWNSSGRSKCEKSRDDTGTFDACRAGDCAGERVRDELILGLACREAIRRAGAALGESGDGDNGPL